MRFASLRGLVDWLACSATAVALGISQPFAFTQMTSFDKRRRVVDRRDAAAALERDAEARVPAIEPIARAGALWRNFIAIGAGLLTAASTSD